MFRIFDSDGDGNITIEEMTSIVSHLYHLIPEKEREAVGTPDKVYHVYSDIIH